MVQMGLSGCKIHPHHHANQGVCPSCLTQRLSTLSLITSDEQTSLPFAPAGYYSVSSSISTSPSQPHPNGFTVSFVANGVKKSRSSIAFEPRNLDDEDGKKKEKGFWSKLLRFKGKNKDVLRHSNSMRMIERLNMVSYS